MSKGLQQFGRAIAAGLRAAASAIGLGSSGDAGLQQCLDALPDPVVLTNPGLAVVAANPAFTVMAGSMASMLSARVPLQDVLRGWLAAASVDTSDLAAALAALKSAGDSDYLLQHQGVPYRVRQRRLPDGSLMLVFAAMAEQRALAQALAQAQERHALLFEQAPAGMLVSANDDGRILQMNPHARAMLGVPDDIELAALCAQDFYQHEDERASVESALRQRGEVEDRLIALRRFDGQPAWASLSARKLGQPGQRMVMAVLTDVTVLQRSAQAVQLREQTLRSMVDMLPSALWLCRASDGYVLLANRQAHKLLSIPGHVLVGNVAPDIHSNPQTRDELAAELAAHGHVVHREVQLRPPGASTSGMYLLSAAPIDFAGQAALMYSVMDIDERRSREEALLLARSEAENANRKLRELNAELEQIASTDRLTRAFNRRHFEEMAVREMGRSRRYKMPLSLMLFDIDHFKHINDDFGHAAGDVVLKEFVQLLGSRLRASDVLARWGGEEFVVLAPSTSVEEARMVAEKLRDRIAAHAFTEVGSVSASVGVTELHYRDTLDTLLRRADKALYRAKAEGRNQVVVAPIETV